MAGCSAYLADGGYISNGQVEGLIGQALRVPEVVHHIVKDISRNTNFAPGIYNAW